MMLFGSKCSSHWASKERCARCRGVPEDRCASSPDSSLGTTSSVSRSDCAVRKGDSVRQTAAKIASTRAWLPWLMCLSPVTRTATFNFQLPPFAFWGERKPADCWDRRATFCRAPVSRRLFSWLPSWRNIQLHGDLYLRGADAGYTAQSSEVKRSSSLLTSQSGAEKTEEQRRNMAFLHYKAKLGGGE